MKLRFRLFAFWVMFILAVSGGYLYAQEAGDTADPPRVGLGDAPFIPSDEELASLPVETPNPHAVVRPLVRTKWNQFGPYNNLFPRVNGVRPFANCVNVAWVQLMAFHKHPARGKGVSTRLMPQSITVPPVDLNVAYDWDNMLNNYRNEGGDVTERQRNAVAVLMYHFAAARGIINAPSRVMIEIFGYDRSIQSHLRDFYTDAEWEAIIRSQLDAGLPVYYSSACTKGSGHSFIVDGYDDTGKFHINWGWSGQHDGYYSLNALTPGDNNYNRDHTIFINIKPDAGSTGTHDMGLATFTANKTTVQQNELLTVRTRIVSAGHFASGQAGVALTDNNGNIAAILETRTYTAVTHPGSTFSSVEINSFVPETVRPGQYRLRIVTRPEGGEWRIVERSMISKGVPNAINLTVTAETGTPGGGYGMGLTAFTASTNVVPQNELFTVTYTLRNFAGETFPGGHAGAALIDNNGNIATILGTRTRATLKPEGRANSVTMDCFVPETVKPGQYRLRMVIRPDGAEQWRVVTLARPDVQTALNFTVSSGEAMGGGYGMGLTTFTASTTSAPQNERFTVTFQLRNMGPDAFPDGQSAVALVDNNGNIVEVFGIGNNGLRNPGTMTALLTRNITVPNTVKPGLYRLRIVVRPTGGEWRNATMSMPDVPTGVDFTVR